MVIGVANAFFLLIFRPYKLGDLLKIRLIKNAKKSRACGDWGPDAIFVVIFRPYTLDNLLKIILLKNEKNKS